MPKFKVTKWLTAEGEVHANSKKEAAEKFQNSNWDMNLNAERMDVERSDARMRLKRKNRSIWRI